MSDAVAPPLRRRPRPRGAALGARLDDLRLALSAARRPPAARRADAARHRHRRLHRRGDDVAAQRPADLDRQEHGRPRRRRLPDPAPAAISASAPLSPEIQRRKNLTLAHVLRLRDALPQAHQVGGEVWEGGKRSSPASNTRPRARQVAGGTAEFFTNNNLPLGAAGAATARPRRRAPRGWWCSAPRSATCSSPRGDPVGQHVRLGRLELRGDRHPRAPGRQPARRQPRQPDLHPHHALPRALRHRRARVNITVMAREPRRDGAPARPGHRRLPHASAASTPRPTTTSTSSPTTRPRGDLRSARRPVTIAGFVICALSLSSAASA